MWKITDQVMVLEQLLEIFANKEFICAQFFVFYYFLLAFFISFSCLPGSVIKHLK